MSHYEILASCFHAVLSKLSMLHHCVMKLQGKGKASTTRKEHCAPTLHVFEIEKMSNVGFNVGIHPSMVAIQLPSERHGTPWTNTIKIKCNFVRDGRRMPPKMC